MANGLLDPAWASDLAALEQRQKLAAAAEARAARSGGTTVLRRPTARSVEEAFPINEGYTTPATDYLVPSRSGEVGTGVVVSPLAQDPFFKQPPSSTVASLLAGDAVMSMTKEALADTPQNALKKSIDAGAQVAQDKNQQREQSGFLSTLLGNVNWQRLLSTLARPELQQAGISPASAFVNAAFAQRQAEAGAAAARQQQMVEQAKLLTDIEKERIKAGAAGVPKWDATLYGYTMDVAQGQQALQKLQEMLSLAQGQKLTGAGRQGLELANNILKAVGIDIGVTGVEEYRKNAAEMKAFLAGQKLFGREMNKQELKIMEQIITDPGVFNTNSELRNQLRSLIAKINADVGAKSRLLQAMGKGDALRAVLEGNLNTSGQASVFRD